MKGLRLFLREIRIEHTLFALPFAYVGAILAAHGLPPPAKLVWITLAVLGARTAAKLYAVCTAAAYLWLPIAYVLGVPALAVALAALAIPIAIWRIAADVTDAAQYERSTFFAVALVVAAAGTMLAGVLIAA